MKLCRNVQRPTESSKYIHQNKIRSKNLRGNIAVNRTPDENVVNLEISLAMANDSKSTQKFTSDLAVLGMDKE